MNMSRKQATRTQKLLRFLGEQRNCDTSQTYMSEQFSNATTVWYNQKVPLYPGLTEIVATTISNLLKIKSVDYLALDSRVKSLESVIEKIDRKEYSGPEAVTDLAGIRVITYIETDIERIGRLLGEAFQIHPDKSLNKSVELGTNQIGYRSVHFVCELGRNRAELPEFSAYNGLVFEVQVRTVLQHAWAEIEHDRNYKFAGVLPFQIRRRLNLLAGTLEIIDREFASLAQEVDTYTNELKTIVKAGDLGTVEITTLSLREFLTTQIDIPEGVTVKPSASNSFEVLVRELNQFGVSIVDDLRKLFTPDFFAALNKTVKTSTEIGLFRKAMMYSDLDRYFDRSWEEKWREMNASSRRLLNQKYGETKLKNILTQYGINQKGSKE
jgi:putative GTP pyrophosphokinase